MLNNATRSNIPRSDAAQQDPARQDPARQRIAATKPPGSTRRSFTLAPILKHKTQQPCHRVRGVRGSNMQLAPIVEHCGRHALTVDLAGGSMATVIQLHR
jgi:hypothetical protein